MRITRDDAKTASFDDILVIDHERGLGLLTDIEEQPGTRKPSEGILSAHGEFVYELEFYINSLLVLAHDIKWIRVEVFDRDPSDRGRGNPSADISRDAVHKMIGDLKREEEIASEEANDPVGHRVFRDKRHKPRLIGYSTLHLRRELNLDDFEKFKRYQDAGKEPEPQTYTYVTDEPEKDLEEPEVSGVGAAVDNLKIDENVKRGINAGITDAGSFHKTALSAVFREGKDPSNFALARHPAAGPTAPRLGDINTYTPNRRNERENRKTSRNHQTRSQGHGSPGDRVSLMRRTPLVTPVHFSAGRNSIWSPAISKLVQQATTIESAPPSIKKGSDVQSSASTTWRPPPPPEIVKFESRLIAVERTVSVNLKRAGLAPVLYWRLSLMRRTTIAGRKRLEPFLSKTFRVPHRSQMEELLTPEIPPSISAGARMRGRNTLTVTQLDPVGTKVVIQRKTMNPHTSNSATGEDEMRYVEVATVNLTQEMGPERVTDTGVSNVGMGLNIYRVTSVGPTGRTSEEYSSVVVKSLQPIVGTGESAVREETHVSIHARNDYTRIVVDITQIPPGAMAVGLLREDLSADSFTYNSGRSLHLVPEYGSGRTMIMIPKGTRSIRFDDLDVTPFMKYRYLAVLRMAHGPEVEATGDEVIVHRRPRIVVPVKSSIQKISLINHRSRGSDTKGFEVNFDILTKPTLDGLETLAQILKSSGVSEAFIDEVKKDRDRVSNIAAYVMERLDLKTGRREMMGIHSSGKFVDNTQTQIRAGASPLRRGHSYRYIAKLCLRPPEAMFREALTTIPVQHTQTTNTGSPDKAKVLAQKFLFAFGATPGVIPSETELKKGASQSLSALLNQGMTGVEIFEDIVIPNPPPIIERVGVFRNRRGQNVVTWSVAGDVDQIECFYVFGRYKGVHGVLARIMVDEDGGRRKFKYTDRRLSGKVGRIEYTVGAMLDDYSRIRPGKPVSINRPRSLPPELLKNLKRRPKSVPKQKRLRRRFGQLPPVLVKDTD